MPLEFPAFGWMVRLGCTASSVRIPSLLFTAGTSFQTGSVMKDFGFECPHLVDVLKKLLRSDK